MKKLLLSILSVFSLGLCSFAQTGDIDITEVYFSNAGSTSARINSDSVPINRQVFIIATFQHNINNTTIQANDSLSFGYSVDGTKIGETGKEVGQQLTTGNQLPVIIDAFYMTPATPKANVEMCVWSLYNPYNPQTTDNNGTELCRSTFTFFDPNANPPGSVGEVDEFKSISAFYAKESVQVMMDDAIAGKSFDAQIIDLTGQIVLNEKIEINRGGNVFHSISFGDHPQGIYLLKVSSDSYSKTIKFVKN